MSYLLILAFLFFIGSVGGWVLELLYRRFFSKVNKSKKWINPGFCTGPYLPLYGNGLCILYSVAQLEKLFSIDNIIIARLVLFIIMAVFMTLIEYIAGIISLSVYKIRLWDYTEEWGNIQGIICPRFSFYWALLGAVYYFFVHPHILDSLIWLSNNLAFSFFIGLFFGIFTIDVWNSAQLAFKLKKLAEEHQIVMKFELLKYEIRLKREELNKKYNFFNPFKTDRTLKDLVVELKKSLEEKNK